MEEYNVLGGFVIFFNTDRRAMRDVQISRLINGCNLLAVKSPRQSSVGK